MSSITDRADAFLDNSGFDRGPWLVVCFAVGIASWFGLAAPWQWASFIVAALLVAFGFAQVWRANAKRNALILGAISMALATAAGMATVWTRSALVGQEAIEYPRSSMLSGRVLTRQEQPAQERVRITLATRDSESGRAIKVRVNVPSDKDIVGLEEGSVVRLRARLMPPAAPILPGAYNFARRAWFDGLAATGSLIGEIELIEIARDDSVIAQAQRSLSLHVREQLGGASGTIAATLASGDRGSIAKRDEEAMRDAGLTHLLAISGLHVSAVIAAAYFVAIKLLALWPWLTLRVRLPVLAAGLAALAGISYTLLTGAQVPTVRSCVGAMLVLLALALGREPLSMRMVAAAAMVVLLLWPESLVGPSFQMSFAAVIAIIALHSSGPIRAFLAPREESIARRWSRGVAMLFLTGLVIELSLMPIVLFHFHRAGIYGALANVIAIPLVTFISMPLVAIALLLDQIGLGAPVWWLVGLSLDGLLGLAHFTSSQPGAVKLLPELSIATLLLFIAGGLWLALWNGKVRLFALAPISIAMLLVFLTPTPDVLITRDGRHVAITGEGDKLLVLRDSESSYARDNLLELAGVDGDVIPLDQWPGAQCSREFCVLTLTRAGRDWTLLLARNQDLVPERRLAAACDQSDIVIADRWLPRSCQPRWLKADKRFLEREGGLSLFLSEPRYRSVGTSQGEHGWWWGGTR
ncbi:ComEC/Rec2 family competence protein [Qipengyuania sp. DGS5-3]|uniref:ComEC/Rec2 family competence protein n=1 Tax=Qipengyuania sp. DGS5-3 TaxID=3349632 RepID=UPI0036D3024E